MKELRAELGRLRGKRKISQAVLADLLGEKAHSMVGKWEMKKFQQPELPNFLKAMKLASPELRARAPQIVDLPEMSDPDRSVAADHNSGDRYMTHEREAAIVAEEIDSIKDRGLRRRAMTEAMNAIAKVRENPSELAGEKKRHPGRHS